MKERPIIFSGPMVRAIPEGRKTVTRRVVREQPRYPEERIERGPDDRWRLLFPAWGGGQDCVILAPPCDPGDRLWVREAWARAEPFPMTDEEYGMPEVDPRQSPALLAHWRRRIVYRSDLPPGAPAPADSDGRWRPSIHLPRWAARLTLLVVSVGAERLQEITNEEARAEGIPQTAGEAEAAGLFDLAKTPGYEWDNRTSRENFAHLWDTLNAQRAPWASNPYVWRIEFRPEPTP